MVMSTKRRILRVDRWSGVNTREGTAQLILDMPIYSRQITSSEGHRWPQGRAVRDQGGPFDTLKLEYEWPVGRSGLTGQGEKFGLKYTIDTALMPYRSAPAPFTRDGEADVYYQAWVPQSSEAALKNLGTSMIASTIPTNPIVDGSVALAELYREGLPSMVGGTLLRDKAHFFRGLGGEYLNWQFGWAPFVSDLKAAAKAIIDQDDIMKQLAHDSGKNVHRKRYLPTTVESTIVRDSTALWPGTLLSGVYAGVYTRYLETEVVTRQQSFSGCYTFYIDPKTWTTTERIVKEARLLYGLQLTPEVVWNLAPWSWLVDWMFDVGPVLHNLSAFQNDGLVLRYGYVMEQNSRRVHRKSDCQIRHVNTGQISSLHCEDIFLGTRKTRRKATPFGFGLDTSGFTTRQWTILAALGMTRAPRTL